MKRIHPFKNGSWIDLESPTKQEVDDAARAAGIDPATVEDLLLPSLRHKIQFGDSHAFIVMHFPAFKESTLGGAAYEVDFILAKGTIITAHYEKIEILEKFHPQGESAEDENQIFFGILGELLASFEHKLSKVDHWVREIENKMFSGHEKHTIVEISEASRHLIDFRNITAVYPDVLDVMMKEGTKLFGPKFAELSTETLERFNKAKAKLEMLSDTVHELRETNNSLLTTKQNESMRILTIVTIIATVIVGIALIWIGLETIK